MARKKLTGRKAVFAEAGAEILAVIVAVGVGVALFGDRFESQNDFWREIVTGSIGAVAGFLITVPIIRWQLRKKAERAADDASDSSAD